MARQSGRHVHVRPTRTPTTTSIKVEKTHKSGSGPGARGRVLMKADGHASERLEASGVTRIAW